MTLYAAGGYYSGTNEKESWKINNIPRTTKTCPPGYNSWLALR